VFVTEIARSRIFDFCIGKRKVNYPPYLIEAPFNQARDAEYVEVIENVERFEDEIARESQRGKYTFAELEDSEADWEKIERWLARIDVRDFFTAPVRTGVTAALERGRARLEQFAAAVYAHERVQDDKG